MFDTPPPRLGGTSVTELLQAGKIKVQGGPQIPAGSEHQRRSGVCEGLRKQCWELLANPFAESPFLTSDFPFALESVPGPAQVRIVPLTPTLAVRIIPRIEAGRNKEKYNLRFPGFRVWKRKVNEGETAYINTLIARCMGWNSGLEARSGIEPLYAALQAAA